MSHFQLYSQHTRNHNVVDPTAKKRKKYKPVAHDKRSRYSDADVIAAVIARELGIPGTVIASWLGCKPETIYQWCSGTNR
jgi:hypothetical protein